MGFIEEHNEKYKSFKSFNIPGPSVETSKGFTVNDWNRNLIFVGSNVTIGIGTIIHPFVFIHDNVHIGEDCTIDSGAVIGAPGFSIHLIEGKAVALKQVGGVKIGDGCEIGANTCIDRASLDGVYTTIGDNVFIDNLVHVAHNVVIGSNTRIAPQVCIGGSTIIGQRVWISIGCSIREHIVIGDDATIQMGAVVIVDVPRGKEYGGFYATDGKKWKDFSKVINAGAFRRLNE